MAGRHVSIPAERRLSLIIPAYNEADGIRQAVREADAALAELAAKYEIIVVDDGSSDDTAAVVAELAGTNPRVRLLRHAHNRGYGAALRTGFAAARFERVACTDADCRFHLADLGTLVALADEQPIAVGYRVARKDPWQRRFVSWGYNCLVRALLGTRVRDCDCALKVFRTDILEQILPESDGFLVNAEMLARARRLGLGVAEAGVRHRPRLRGVSKVSLRDIPRTLCSLLPFWWSRVLFPGVTASLEPAGSDRQAADAPLPKAPALLGVGLLVLAAVLLCFAHLGAPLQEPEEARYAEIPRQMLAEGRWVVPVLHGRTYADKPPLLYWLVMGSYQLGGVHDWSARLVPCLAAFLTVLVTWWWGRWSLGPRGGLAAGFILCLSARFVYLGRLLTMDSLLCLWVVAALATAHRATAGPRLRRGWWLLAAGCCGLGLLTKGPVAPALTVVPLLALQFLDPRTARPGWKAWAAFLGLACGLAAPWYAAMTAWEPGFASYFFWRHNLERYVAPFDHAKPVWFHLLGLLPGMLPWVLLLPGLVRLLGRRDARHADRRPVALGFFLLAFAWSLLFYSLAGSKRPVYILPAMPPLALALGCYLDLLLGRATVSQALRSAARFRQGPAAERLARHATLTVLFGAAVCVLLAVPARLVGLTTGLAVAAALTVAGVAVLGWRRARQPGTAWALCAAATFLVLLGGVHLLLPGYARKFSLRGELKGQAELCNDPEVPVVCYPHRWDSVSFYLRRNDVRVFSSRQRDELMALLRREPGTLLVVKSDDSLKTVLRDLPALLEFVPQGRTGTVTVGLVRPRPGVPETILAGR
jgi:4-amino-4-deoxy-L-arabinose transferase-like glycosyltransferase